MRVGGENDLFGIPKVGGDLGEAEASRQPRGRCGVPQRVASVLPSPLRVDSCGPPCIPPHAVEGIAVQRQAILAGEQQLARDRLAVRRAPRQCDTYRWVLTDVLGQDGYHRIGYRHVPDLAVLHWCEEETPS